MLKPVIWFPVKTLTWKTGLNWLFIVTVVVVAGVGGVRVLEAPQWIVNGDGHHPVVPEVVEGTVFAQPFSTGAATVESVELKIGTHQRENAGKLMVRIVNRHGVELWSSFRAMTEFEDNQWAIFYGSDTVISGDCSVEISSELTESGRAVSLYCMPGEDGSSLPGYFINGQARSGMLAVRIRGVYTGLEKVRILCSLADLDRVRGSRILLFAMCCLFVGFAVFFRIMQVSKIAE